MRVRLILLIGAAVVCLLLLIWNFRFKGQSVPGAAATKPASSAAANGGGNSSDSAPTRIYAHNLMLRHGPHFRVYVRWLRGQMSRTHKNVNPSFDDPDSFFIDIKNGVIHANIGDIGNLLNSGEIPNAPLKNISLSGDGNQIKLSGTLHKVIPIPIVLTGTVSASPGNRIQVHVTKLSVLKIPVKGLLGSFHVSVADLFHPGGVTGIEVSGDDIFFDTQKLLPPPHIRGQLTSVRIVNPDLEEVFGDTQQDVARVEQWRNFFRLREGTIDFGKLTMRHVDLIMIDVSDDAWFDLDLANYQEQLVNGYTRMTPQAGLQIFMPDLRTIPTNKKNQNTRIEWLKNRNVAPPPEVTPK
jgi:hypothetical protein